jgi:hypothetical protein
MIKYKLQQDLLDQTQMKTLLIVSLLLWTVCGQAPIFGQISGTYGTWSGSPIPSSFGQISSPQILAASSHGYSASTPSRSGTALVDGYGNVLQLQSYRSSTGANSFWITNSSSTTGELLATRTIPAAYIQEFSAIGINGDLIAESQSDTYIFQASTQEWVTLDQELFLIIGANGTIFTYMPQANSTSSVVTARNPDLSILWTNNQSSIETPMLWAISPLNNQLVIQSTNKIYSLDPSDGTYIDWIEHNYYSGALNICVDPQGRVLVPSSSQLTLVDQTAGILWSVSNTDFKWNVYALSDSSFILLTEDKVYRINSSGTQLWVASFTTPYVVLGSSQIVASEAYLIIGTDNGVSGFVRINLSTAVQDMFFVVNDIGCSVTAVGDSTLFLACDIGNFVIGNSNGLCFQQSSEDDCLNYEIVLEHGESGVICGWCDDTDSCIDTNCLPNDPENPACCKPSWLEGPCTTNDIPSTFFDCDYGNDLGVGMIILIVVIVLIVLGVAIVGVAYAVIYIKRKRTKDYGVLD